MSVGRALALIVLLAACSSARAPSSHLAVPDHQDAYVWQQNWTPAVRDALVHAPPGIEGFRVLAAEVASDERTLRPLAIDTSALAAAGKPITLVARIDGARPIDSLDLAPLVARADALRAEDVQVAGIEIDHDCATARLSDYARWLATQRRLSSLRFSITALPTWTESPALAQVAATVDEIVVQVHAVRLPAIFDPNVAWHDLVRFAHAVRTTPLRVAVPTYKALVRGKEIEADARDVAAFVRRLAAERVPGVGGIVWFRLPVSGDLQTWSPATFAHIVEVGTADAPRARLALVGRGGGTFDVVATNPGDELVDLPPVHVEGEIDAAEMIGFREVARGTWDAPPRSLAAKQTITIGWIHGKDIALVD